MPVKKKLRARLSQGKGLIVLIFILSFAIRFVYLQEMRANPFFETPISDEKWHDLWAQDIAKGDFIGDQVFFRAPLYPYFLGGIYFVFGHSYLIPRLIQIILGALSCVLIFLIAGILFNRAVATIAGFIASFYGVLVYFDCELLIPNLFIFLILLLLYSLLLKTDKTKPTSWVISGILLGLAAIARPNILIFVPGILVWLMLQFKNKKIVFRTFAFFCFGAGLIIFPVTLRNYLVGKDFVPISSQGGINYYIGNNPDADGKKSVAPGLFMSPEDYVDNVWLSSVKIAEAKRGRYLKPSAVSNFWFSEAIKFLRDDPLAFFKLQFKKLYYFWNGYEIESNKNIYLSRDFSLSFKFLIWVFGLAFPFGIIGPLSIAGMYLCRKQFQKLSLLYLFVPLYMFSVIAFFVTARFRVPVVPFLIIFASYTLHWFYEQLKKRRYHEIIIPSVLFLVLFAFINTNIFDVRGRDELREHFLLGLVYAENGDNNKAMIEYAKAIQTPYDPYDIVTRSNAHHNLGLIYRKKGMYSEAEEEYLEAIKLNPKNAKAYCNLGTLYAVCGFKDKAVWAYRQALVIDPQYKAARMNLEMLLQKKTSSF